MAKVDYAALAARADSPSPEAPAPKRAKRARGAAAAAAMPAQATAPAPAPSPSASAGDELDGVSGRITLSRATGEEFCLSKAQLEAASLPYATARNPHAKSAAPMRLYDHRQVLELALRIHGGRAGLDAARAKRAARSQRAAEAAAERTGGRRTALRPSGR